MSPAEHIRWVRTYLFLSAGEGETIVSFRLPVPLGTCPLPIREDTDPSTLQTGDAVPMPNAGRLTGTHGYLCRGPPGVFAGSRLCHRALARARFCVGGTYGLALGRSTLAQVDAEDRHRSNSQEL